MCQGSETPTALFCNVLDRQRAAQQSNVASRHKYSITALRTTLAHTRPGTGSWLFNDTASMACQRRLVPAQPAQERLVQS